MGFLDDLKAKIAAEKEAVKRAELTPDEQEQATALAEYQKLCEERAAAEKAKRGLDMAAREAAAKAAGGKRYLVKGIDLIDLFPLGTAPAAEQLPGNGVIVVRSPEPARLDAMSAEVEHKKRPVSAIMADLLIDSTVDPDHRKDDALGIRLRDFCDAFPGAATNAGGMVAELGGLKTRADKRGRT